MYEPRDVKFAQRLVIFIIDFSRLLTNLFGCRFFSFRIPAGKAKRFETNPTRPRRCGTTGRFISKRIEWRQIIMANPNGTGYDAPNP
jgi:hypothetical protein